MSWCYHVVTLSVVSPLFLLPTTTRLDPSFSILCRVWLNQFSSQSYTCCTWFVILHITCFLTEKAFCQKAAQKLPLQAEFSHVLCAQNMSGRQWDVGTTSCSIFKIKQLVQISFHFKNMIQNLCWVSRPQLWSEQFNAGSVRSTALKHSC